MDPMPTNRNPDWAVTEVRLVLGPARTVGDLLAALVELMTVTGVEAHDVCFDEVPDGRLLVAACRLRPGGGDAVELLRSLVVDPVTVSL